MTATEQIAELRAVVRAASQALTELGAPPEVGEEELRAGIGQAERRRARAGR